MKLAAVLCLLAACATPDEGETVQAALTQQQRHDRLTLIRDSAREVGVFNAALIGGIAISETNLAHCYSEAGFACPGPPSPSCGGEPVIAGGADGPCSDMQGGLGMFQFDSGTFTQTLATYGDRILTVEGNTEQVVAFLVERMKQSIDGVTDWMSAVEYINAIPLEAGNPVTDGWGAFLACRYNGCCAQTSTCIGRGNKYRDNGINLFAEKGADFWHTSDACSELPPDGVIETRSECYLAGGDPRYWRREDVGHDGASEWTSTTTSAAPANFARWKIPPIGPARVRIEIYADGGEATASYSIVHAGVTETVEIDQSASSGFVQLTEVDVLGDGTEYVEVGDNTGTSMQKLVVDAARITVLGGEGEEMPPGDGGGDGGCNVGGSAGLGVASLLLALCRRRRAGRR